MRRIQVLKDKGTEHGQHEVTKTRASVLQKVVDGKEVSSSHQNTADASASRKEHAAIIRSNAHLP